MRMAIKKTLVVCYLASLATPVFAGGVDGQAVLGGALGGATGAAVGSAIGGRDGAIIGGAIGGAAGVAIATDGNKSEKPATKEVIVEKEVVYVPARHDNGLHLGHSKRKHDHDHD
jgi:outer membrane lipoprotein SlyB